jgi:hypothetical protein
MFLHRKTKREIERQREKEKKEVRHEDGTEILFKIVKVSLSLSFSLSLSPPSSLFLPPTKTHTHTDLRWVKVVVEESVELTHEEVEGGEEGCPSAGSGDEGSPIRCVLTARCEEALQRVQARQVVFTQFGEGVLHSPYGRAVQRRHDLPHAVVVAEALQRLEEADESADDVSTFRLLRLHDDVGRDPLRHGPGMRNQSAVIVRE